MNHVPVSASLRVATPTDYLFFIIRMHSLMPVTRTISERVP